MSWRDDPLLYIVVSAVAAFGLGFGAFEAILRVSDKEKVSKGTYVLKTDLDREYLSRVAVEQEFISRKEIAEGAIRGREQWMRATPPASCQTVCSPHLRPVRTGQDDSGQLFFVCRAAGRRDERPGFNVDANERTKDKCAILSDGAPSYESVYDCLCLPSS